MAEIKPLVSKLLEGDLRTAQPLIDLLQELKDTRVYNVLNYLTDLQDRYNAQNQKNSKLSFRSEKETEFRSDEFKYRVWAEFADRITHLFWYEINGLPDLGFLRTLGKELSSDRQAVRFAEAFKIAQTQAEYSNVPQGTEREGMSVIGQDMNEPADYEVRQNRMRRRFAE